MTAAQGLRKAAVKMGKTADWRHVTEVESGRPVDGLDVRRKEEGENKNDSLISA